MSINPMTWENLPDISPTQLKNDVKSGETSTVQPPKNNDVEADFANVLSQAYSVVLSVKKQKPSIEGFNFDKQTPASLIVYSPEPSLLIAYEKFILTEVRENRREKFQIFETFDLPSIFFFNERTKMYSFSGYLVDGEHQERRGSKVTDAREWTTQFKKLWDSKLRGTVLAKNGHIAILNFNNNLIYGYPVNLTLGNSANAPFIASFSFDMIVVDHKLPNLYTPKSISSVLTDEDRESLQKLVDKASELKKAISELREKISTLTKPEEIKKANAELSKKITSYNNVKIDILMFVQGLMYKSH